MDVFNELSSSNSTVIKCIDMHTTGEPTRILISGYPLFPADKMTTLLHQRSYALSQHDNIRRILMLEPRGHFDMYGAILRPDTELTRSGEAHMGVLFTTNDGYSSMCGHATMALGRFLLDTHDKAVFPKRDDIKIDTKNLTASLGLHAPCGLVNVTVPIVDLMGSKSDPTRPVSFVNVPSFTTGVDVSIAIPEDLRWPELQDRNSVTVDFSYGGAFYCFVSANALGFPKGLREVDFEAMQKATRNLKQSIVLNGITTQTQQRGRQYDSYFRHPKHDDLSFLYSIIVVDKSLPPSSSTVPNKATQKIKENDATAETGLCFYADQAIDRSPTGSAVAARVALAYSRNELSLGHSRNYHSLLSVHSLSNNNNNKNKNENESKGGEKDGSFVGKLLAEVPGYHTGSAYPAVSVEVRGYAYYTGTHSFVCEEGKDPLGRDGFVFEQLDGV